MPHPEGHDEIPGLRFWGGGPMVRLLEADEGLSVTLLERCLPGTPLRGRPDPEQDEVTAGLLREIWHMPPPPHLFRPLSQMLALWTVSTRSDAARWPDVALVEKGLRLLDELPRSASRQVLLATICTRPPCSTVMPPPAPAPRARTGRCS